MGRDAAREQFVADEIDANSSPPLRASVSFVEIGRPSRCATPLSNSSPTLWPSVSLTSLNRSRSRKRTSISSLPPRAIRLSRLRLNARRLRRRHPLLIPRPGHQKGRRIAPAAVLFERAA